MKRSVRAQATLFVILGIVLLSVFSFALYARSLLVTDKLQSQAELILSDFVQTNSISYYVESCLDQVSTTLLFQIGAQGGRLNVDELTPWEDYFLYEKNDVTYPVTYAIQPNDRCDEVSLLPPQYPRDRTYLYDLQTIYETSSCRTDQLSGFFGKTTLPKLCDYRGANSYSESGTLAFACDRLAYTLAEDNMQRELEQAITKEMQSCVDFSVFENAEMELQEDLINTTVIYKQDGVTVQSSFPFTIRIGGRTVIAREKFSHTSPIRIKRMYEYLMDLVKKEAKDYTFNADDNYMLVPRYYESFNYTKISNPCIDQDDCPTENLYDDIIRVHDKEILVNNKTFMFQIAIPNRKPALDYIHDPNIGDVKYDIKVIENETIYIHPKGYDPDDAQVEYTYTGWKETEDATFNFDCLIETPPPDNPAEECVIRLTDVEPKNWTTSPPFLTTGRNANYTVNRSDTGAHNVSVYVTDEGGLFDYQILKILVFDLPVAVANGSNGFAEINNSYASIEDPYILNGSGSLASIVSGGSLSEYYWNGYEGEERTLTHSFMVTNPVITVPYHINPTTILTLVPFFLNVSATEILPTDYELELQVNSGEPFNIYSDFSSYELELYECLPANNESSDYPYPYNTTDVYSYNHICCLGEVVDGGPSGYAWGTIVDAATKTPCFGITEKGLLVELNNIHFSSSGNDDIDPESVSNTYYPMIGRQIPASALSSLTSNYHNDPFEKETTRYCDGTRGNICQGNMTYTYTQQAMCEDFTGDQEERCEGPNEDNTGCITYNFYSTKSFEYEYRSLGFTKKDGSSPNGICDSDWECSGEQTTNTYGTGNGWKCQAGCSSDGCVQAINCVCEESCGSTCDEPTDYDYNSGTKRCSYGCDYLGSNPSCDYQTENVYCPEYVICNSHKSNTQYGSCMGTTRNVQLSIQYYYYLDETCDATGCHPQHIELLYEDYCYELNGATVTENDYCPEPGTTHEGQCYYTATGTDTRYCNSNDECAGISTTPIMTDANDCKATYYDEPNGVFYDGAKCTSTGTICCLSTTTGCVTP